MYGAVSVDNQLTPARSHVAHLTSPIAMIRILEVLHAQGLDIRLRIGIHAALVAVGGCGGATQRGLGSCER